MCFVTFDYIDYSKKRELFLKFDSRKEAMEHLEDEGFYRDGSDCPGLYLSYWNDELKCDAKLFFNSRKNECQ